MPPPGIELELPTSKLLQTYALDLAATRIGDCGFTNLKLTVWDGKFDSEMNIAI